jgi:anti-sigma regulatory factor (Ser/Thr protein kinase)
MCPDTPPNMFITCFYAVLDPASGKLQYANAGHDVPYVRTAAGTAELRARGMPLGLMPGMDYEEKEATLDPGQTLVMYSDGIVEAHNPQRGMFGFPRLRGLLAEHPSDDTIIDFLLEQLDDFTGPGWEQEDDVTLVTLRRSPLRLGDGHGDGAAQTNGISRILDEFTLPSQSGNELQAMERVAQAIAALNLPERRLKRLKTAVAEATMNAIEHGNQNRAELPVAVRVSASDHDLTIRIVDLGGGRTHGLKAIPEPETPDLEAKLAGEQRTRGWGLFLIKNMVDEMHVSSDDTHHTIELKLHLNKQEQLQEGSHASNTHRAL